MSEELFEKGEPRNNLIVVLAIFTILSLALAAWGFTSLYKSVTLRVEDQVINGLVLGAQLSADVDPLAIKRAVKAEQTAQLSAGSMSIDQAIEAYGRRGRNAAAITIARPSEDEVPYWDRWNDPVGGAVAAAEEAQVEAEAGDTVRENAANAADALEDGIAPEIEAAAGAGEEAEAPAEEAAAEEAVQEDPNAPAAEAGEAEPEVPANAPAPVNNNNDPVEATP